MTQKMKTIEGSEAVARVAYKLCEVIAIYPITPSSPLGEYADQWSSDNQPNIWGTSPSVVEMQSEAGAAGAVHGALQTGAMTSTFTASQGLLLMIPNMHKIAGELTSVVFHVAARSIAAQALSIFGDHSDVMSTRMTGFALLSSNSVQEAQDLACIAHATTLEARVPFLHFFDGFRTSHEISKISLLTDDQIRSMIDDDLVLQHRSRGLSPENPFIRGTSQNPDVYFQARETVNPYYERCPELVQKNMDLFADVTGRQYHLFDYFGAPDAERVVVLMGSGAETIHETIQHLLQTGEKVGVVKVRLFRPFSIAHFIQTLPKTTQKITVLDRTKEPGSIGEPLYQDVVAAINEFNQSGSSHFIKQPRITGGRYGLSSKEFTPGMVKGILDEMTKPSPKNHFTIGIIDDVTMTSLDYDPGYSSTTNSVYGAVFYGLGSDGTVGANKNTVKIIGDNTDANAQGYFVYDSKKAGAVTISHLRFSPDLIHSPYLIDQADFVACHQFNFLERIDVLGSAKENGTFLLNSPYSAETVWDHLPQEVQKQIIDKNLDFYVVDGYKIAELVELGRRINTILQVCFFSISNIIPIEEALEHIKKSIRETYGSGGESIVQKNLAAVDMSISHLHKVLIPSQITSNSVIQPAVPVAAPEFVHNVIGKMIARQGDLIPVSALPQDGTYPSGTTKWEKRNIALNIPVWDEDICIQCGKCVMVCPHAVIRAKIYDPDVLELAPETFKSVPARWKEYKDSRYTLQVSPEDCTGCTLCVDICPVTNKQDLVLKALNMSPYTSNLKETEIKNWDFFLQLPEADRNELSFGQVKDIQLLQPLFEFSGACAGCGETPYLKLLSQLFGERTVIANATGCSSIYGGNLPTTPWSTNNAGRGPAWSNSLFEDNAEFGLGMRLTLDKQTEYAHELIDRLAHVIADDDLITSINSSDQSDEKGIGEQRLRILQLRQKLENIDSPEARDLLSLADMFVTKSVWIVGGDGWAYDIGYGGLDHVLASGRNVNILVLDTEVYSNTGGQMSKSTPRAAIAKFAQGGKKRGKKDLGALAMTYGHVYVASVALGANDSQTVKAFREAQAYQGSSLIIAYSHCIEHKYGMEDGLRHQQAAVKSGYWPLYRFNPDLPLTGKPAFQLDSKRPQIELEDFLYMEGRFKMLVKNDPDLAKTLLDQSKKDIEEKFNWFEKLSQHKVVDSH